MKPIGGFFELELPGRGSDPHPDAIALSTGRACLMVTLDHLKPALVHVPFHTCDATLEPFHKLKVPAKYYALADDLSPAALPVLGSSDFFLWTDYYGVCGAITERLKEHYGAKLLIDDTHAFHRKGHTGHWSFTSARKYFGVPDGAYLYAPLPVKVDAPRFDRASLTHNALRSMGRQEEAYAAYTAYERSLTCDVHRISPISEGLLRGVDQEAVKTARIRNFHFLHEQLGGRNTLALDPRAEEVPFCYPYLPEHAVDRQAMYAKGLFAPVLWPDALHRNVEGFDFEKRISTQLLPLPVDHRYTPDDLRRFTEHLNAR